MGNNLEQLWAKALTQEHEYLESEEGNAVQNEHGVYAYQSFDGSHLLSLDFFLLRYKEWLIENGYVKELT